MKSQIDEKEELVLQFKAARIFLAEAAGIVVSIEDITEQKWAEEALKSSEANIRAMSINDMTIELTQ